ncbi:GntR family transcriptional regulator (plasmid) [Enterocloster clostridioformis]
MKINLRNDTLPSYLGVYNSLYTDIMNGVYPPETYLPGETALSEKYGVSRNTLRQALAILSEDGLIIKSQGKGTVVAPRSQSATTKPITNLMLTPKKCSVTETTLTYNYGSPTDIARHKLSLSENDIVLACNCVYRSEETVLGYTFTQIAAAFFPDLNLNTADQESIKTAVMETVFHYAAKETLTIKLIYANDMEVEFLNVPMGTPLILIESIYFNRADAPFARYKFYILPEYYHLEFTRT